MKEDVNLLIYFYSICMVHILYIIYIKKKQNKTIQILNANIFSHNYDQMRFNNWFVRAEIFVIILYNNICKKMLKLHANPIHLYNIILCSIILLCYIIIPDCLYFIHNIGMRFLYSYCCYPLKWQIFCWFHC